MNEILLLLTALIPLQADAGRSELALEIGRLTAQARLEQARYALRILKLPSREIVYEHRPQEGLVPASNVKLATAAAAIEILGPHFEFTTTFGVLGDDLAIVGSGDPTLGDSVLAERAGKEPDQILDEWAAALKQRGLSSIPGDLIVDDSIFDRETVHPNWPKNQLLRWYAAPVAGLNYNNNCLDMWVTPTKRGQLAAFRVRPPSSFLTVENRCRTSTKGIKIILDRDASGRKVLLSGHCSKPMKEPQHIAVADPAMLFAYAVRDAMARASVEIAGKIRRGRIADGQGSSLAMEIVATHRTPLRDVLWRVNTRSLNMAAECLLKTLGAQNGPGGWDSGCRVVGNFLERIGAPPASFAIDDGGGLSRRNICTVYVITEIMAYMFNSPNRDIFMESLAVSGETGTLRRRLKSPNLRGKILGKTGTLRGVSALSGYVQRDGEWLCFSMIFNDVVGKRYQRCRKLQIQICDVLANGSKAD
jgi:D-alanyl-D-alanine carboxypeptidase/D-alanyl-D-alanine-endopeptidase (penicillin-binding protein 4)